MCRLTRFSLPLVLILLPLSGAASAKESGPSRIPCPRALAALRQSTFHLDVGVARLKDGKDCLTTPGFPCEWEVTLTRAQTLGKDRQFLLAIVNANHLLGSGAWDSVFLYVCQGGMFEPVLTERSLYGFRVEIGSDGDLWMTSGVWRRDDSTCCPSSELRRLFVWDSGLSRFIVKESSTRRLKSPQ
jgi:hypothetical protein